MRIAALLHREEVLVLHDRANGPHGAAEAGKFSAEKQAAAVMGRVGRYPAVFLEKLGSDLAGDDAVQRVRAR